MAFVSVKEFAGIKGVSPTAVQKAIKSGRLVNSVKYNAAGKCPKIDPIVAMQEWERNTQHEQRRTGSDIRKPEPRPQPFIKPDVPRPDEQPDDAKRTLAEAILMKETYTAERTKLKFEIESGKYVESADVKNEAFKVGRTVRDNIMNIPDRLAAELAGLSDAAEVHAKLTAELRQALEALAGGQNE